MGLLQQPRKRFGPAFSLLLGLQDIILLPRDWDADMTNSLTTTASKETYFYPFQHFNDVCNGIAVF